MSLQAERPARPAESYLQLLVRVFLGVFAPLALFAEFLQLSLALVQCITFAPLLRLVFLQCSLRNECQNNVGNEPVYPSHSPRGHSGPSPWVAALAQLQT